MTANIPSAQTLGEAKVSLLVIDETARASDELYPAMRPVLAVSGGAEYGRISKEFREEERRTHTDEWFGQKYLCEFVQDWKGLFDMDLVGWAFIDEFEPLMEAAISVLSCVLPGHSDQLAVSAQGSRRRTAGGMIMRGV